MLIRRICDFVSERWGERNCSGRYYSNFIIIFALILCGAFFPCDDFQYVSLEKSVGLPIESRLPQRSQQLCL